MRWSVLAAGAMAWACGNATAQAPKKFALLVGIDRYEHASIPKLECAEADAKAVGELLRGSGYKVESLLGRAATKAAILAKLAEAEGWGDAEGVAVIGLFGHGGERADTKESIFKPYDTKLVAQRDANGNALFDRDGTNPLLEDKLDSLIGMKEFLAALGLTPAGGRVLLADCCRVRPLRARGRGLEAFGKSFDKRLLPERCAAVFACASEEEALEHPTKGQGIFTLALLEAARSRPREQLALPALCAHLKFEVPRLIRAIPGEKRTQNPKFFLDDAADLQLSAAAPKAAPAALSAPFGAAAAAAGQRAWAEHLGTEVRAMNTVGMDMILIPPGAFLMGADEPRERLTEQFPSERFTPLHNEYPPVRTSQQKPFRIAATETTREQFRRFAAEAEFKTDVERGFVLEKGKNPTGLNSDETGRSWKRPAEGNPQDRHPVTYVSWNDAQAFCRWLSAKEAKKYRLPTQVEWEYAVRAGTQSRYWNGNDPEKLALIANVPQAPKSRDEALSEHWDAWYLRGVENGFDDWNRISAKLGATAVLRFARGKDGQPHWEIAGYRPADAGMADRGMIAVENADPNATLHVQDGAGAAQEVGPGKSLELKPANANAGGAQFVKQDDGFAGLAPVASFRANPFGLYDVHGNVWEWCEDRYDASRDRKPVVGPHYVLRGGCLY